MIYFIAYNDRLYERPRPKIIKKCKNGVSKNQICVSFTNNTKNVYFLINAVV